jgi:hypothetical protein
MAAKVTLSVHIFDENVVAHRQKAALVSARPSYVRARKCYSEAGCLLDTEYVYSNSAGIF